MVRKQEKFRKKNPGTSAIPFLLKSMSDPVGNPRDCFPHVMAQKKKSHPTEGLFHLCSRIMRLAEVIKHFSSSAQLSMKFQLLINVEIIKINEKFRFKTKKPVIYPAHKC